MALKPLKPTTDPASDILRSQRHPLAALFSPTTVAVVGATDRQGSVGRTLLWNLISSPFGGTVFPINPKRSNVLGIKAYPSLTAVPEPIDLVVIITPAPSVPDLIQECVEVGAGGVIVISAGFKEAGATGVALEQRILEVLKNTQMRLIGPNCLGLMNPCTGLNATFASAMARRGHVGFISQSGALCTAVLDWSFPENVGFSAFVSIGSMLDVSWGDLIDYLGDDPNTHSIVIYMESIGNARTFLSAAREVAMSKPIIVIKTGRTEAAAKAAASHTGTLAGSDAVLDAAFRRCGVLRVDRISELFNLAEVLAKQDTRPKGPKLTIITNAGGPGVLTTDALIATGGQLATLTDETIQRLNEFLPKHWSHGNPVDILGDAEPERYIKTLEVVAQDPNSDGILVILTPQSMTDPTLTAEHLKAWVEKSRDQLGDKPILASWMGGAEVKAGETILNRCNIPTYPYPDSAARLFNLMWRYAYNLQGIYETPRLVIDSVDEQEERQQVNALLDHVRQDQRTLLSEEESKQLLAAYGIPVSPTGVATSAEAAIALADQMGYPVVLKLWSRTITHKTDVGGVQLNLNHPEAVRQAYRDIQSSVTEKVGAEHFQGVTVQPMVNRDGGYELIIGSSIDPQFGPVLLFGLGGQLVEVFKDRAIALPPLTTTLARRMMEQTKIYSVFQGVRGRRPIDTGELEQLLVRFSHLVVEHPWIKEIDINPVFVSPDQIIALDARVILHDLDTPEAQLPKPAIRPYPVQYVAPWTMPNGETVTIRPISPEDEPMMVQFHETLSEQSVYLRYFHLMKLSRRTSHERLARLCFMDYDREMALVAEYKQPETGKTEILGVARLSKQHGINEAEFAMLVSDPYQKQGLGTELLHRLVQVGKDEKLDRITAEILTENIAMQRVCEKVGFKLKRGSEVVHASLKL